MSHEKEKSTVEEVYARELPYLIAREMRNLKMNRQEFSKHVGISPEQLDEYRREGGNLPRSDTLLKIISKCSVEFLADVIATAGLHDKYSIVRVVDEVESGASRIEVYRRASNL